MKKRKILILLLLLVTSQRLFGQSSLTYLNNTQYTVGNLQGPLFLLFPHSLSITQTETDYVIEIVQQKTNQFDQTGALIGTSLTFRFLVSKWVNRRINSGPRGSPSTFERVLINIGYGNQGQAGTIVVRQNIQVGTGTLRYLTPTGFFNVPFTVFISPSTNNLN